MKDILLIIGTIIIIILLANILGLDKELFVSEKNLYFIVMKSIPDRVNNINSIIKTHDLTNYDIFSAVDGNKLDRQQLLKAGVIDENTKKKMRSGAIGCALSHITIWKKNQNKKFIVVLEDDIDLPHHFKKKLSNFLHSVPKSFDICQIYHWAGKKTEDYRKSPNLNQYVKSGYPQLGTVGYIISKRGMKRLLKKCLPIYSAIDVMIQDQIKNGYITSFVPVETLVMHRYKFESSVCGGGRHCKPSIEN